MREMDEDDGKYRIKFTGKNRDKFHSRVNPVADGLHGDSPVKQQKSFGGLKKGFLNKTKSESTDGIGRKEQVTNKPGLSALEMLRGETNVNREQVVP